MKEAGWVKRRLGRGEPGRTVRRPTRMDSRVSGGPGNESFDSSARAPVREPAANHGKAPDKILRAIRTGIGIHI